MKKLVIMICAVMVAMIMGVGAAYGNTGICPDDCPSGMMDNYCDNEKDNRCDPDCFKSDPDCKDYEEEGNYTNIEDHTFLKIGLIVIFILIIYIDFYSI